jgi:conjugative element/phage-associated large polyvalent protein
MDDKFPPLDLSPRPETWAYRMPQAFLGLTPTFWAMPMPLAPLSDVWNHRSLIAPFGPPPSRGILGQLTQLIDPPTSQTAWNSPTFLTPFLQPVSAKTAQLNSSSYQSSVPAGSPKPLGANAGFASSPVEPVYQPSTHPSPEEVGGPPVQPPAPRGVPVPNSSVPEAAPPAPREDFRTRLREALSDRNLRYYAGPGFSEFLDKLAGLIPLLPGSGTVQSMQDGAQAGKDFDAGNYGNAAVHLGAGVVNTGLDWLPGGKQLAILGGMTAKTFPWAKLKIAEAMEKAGKSVDEIWRATGLERGADNFWRFEISDRGYRVKPNVGILDNEGFRGAPLYEQQVHPGMQAAYPSLAGAQSKIRIDPNGPELGVFEPGGISVEAPIRSPVKYISTHELQHMIDHLEGHARGGQPLEFMKPGISVEEARELYRRLAGEVAARNAQSRLYESELQRQRKSPVRTEDRPRDQQIIRFSPRD